jgi:hypothetical protein
MKGMVKKRVNNFVREFSGVNDESKVGGYKLVDVASLEVLNG